VVAVDEHPWASTRCKWEFLGVYCFGGNCRGERNRSHYIKDKGGLPDVFERVIGFRFYEIRLVVEGIEGGVGNYPVAIGR